MVRWLVCHKLIKIAQKFDLKLISIEDLIKYRIKTETSIEKIIDVNMPTKYGDFEMALYKNTNTDEEHLALVKGNWKEKRTCPCTCSLFLYDWRYIRFLSLRLWSTTT